MFGACPSLPTGFDLAAIDRLLVGACDRVTVQPDGQMMLSAPPPSVLFPGSFNPIHDGHLLLARVAEEIRQQPVAFEISVPNVDKPPLAAETVRRRLAQFAWKSAVEVTRAPTVPILQFALLEGISHGVSTRNGGVSRGRESRVQLLQKYRFRPDHGSQTGFLGMKTAGPVEYFQKGTEGNLPILNIGAR
ncbi:hypothetical protein B4Q13_15645 [Lacticaseibacillus rhamnosus]